MIKFQREFLEISGDKQILLQLGFGVGTVMIVGEGSAFDLGMREGDNA